jgi:Asp-tRNA(Asn)/Glu-tRNA(Gln) amidotransferase C subunit
MKISEITRRNIIDKLRVSGISWCGRLDEVSFLKRIFHLQEMPSYDRRLSNMADDIYQHRVDFIDWKDDWVFDDPRINLLECDDDIFLNFLCELIHPVVRVNSSETEQLLKIFNKHLEADGYEICEIQKMSGRPIFAARSITIPIMLDNLTKFDYKFVTEQAGKCDLKLREGDYDGAISSARSLVEGVLGEIYLKCTGNRLEESGDLLRDYKNVKDLLNLSEEKISNGSLKGIIRSLNGIIQNIDTLSNKMGDRHRPLISPARHQAKFVVDSAKTISDFLFSTMESQNDRINSFLDQLLEILNSEKRFFTREQLLNDSDIKDLLLTSDIYLRQRVKDEFFKRFEVDSYRKSDIYFAVMRVFFEELTVDDVIEIFLESVRNDQMISWEEFNKELLSQKSELLGQAYKKIYE